MSKIQLFYRLGWALAFGDSRHVQAVLLEFIYWGYEPEMLESLFYAMHRNEKWEIERAICLYKNGHRWWPCTFEKPLRIQPVCRQLVTQPLWKSRRRSK